MYVCIYDTHTMALQGSVSVYKGFGGIGSTWVVSRWLWWLIEGLVCIYFLKNKKSDLYINKTGICYLYIK